MNCRLARKAKDEVQGIGVQSELDLWVPADNIMTHTKSLNTAINPLLKESPISSESEKNKLLLIFPFSFGSLIDFTD